MRIKHSLFWSILLTVSAAARAPGQKIQDQPDDGQWSRQAKNYASTASVLSLTDINSETARNLKLAWTFSTGLTRGQEAIPLVLSNTMYIVTPWPNILYALDLTKPSVIT
jgi:glucose dehydrogenase